MAHVLSGEELFCLRGCRSYEQYSKMRKGFEAGQCAFCQVDRAFNKIECENDAWMMWRVPAQFLRKETEHHMLIVPKRHIRFLWDLSAMEWAQHAEVWLYILERYGDALKTKGGINAIRWGDMAYNAGTVPHLHMNVMVPSKQGELRIPVFKEEDHAQDNMIRMAGFAAAYEKGDMPQAAA